MDYGGYRESVQYYNILKSKKVNGQKKDCKIESGRSNIVSYNMKNRCYNRAKQSTGVISDG